jgi:hypothetical protein
MTEIDESIFLNADKFYFAVEELVWEDDLTYIEATLKTCETFLIDLEDVYKLKLINPILKGKLLHEGTEEGYLKRSAVLPF